MQYGNKDVFISHAYSDKETYINPLVDTLQKYGISYWIDTDQIPWGASLMLEISEGLRVSQFVLLCLSRETFDRKWAEHEMGAAISIQNRFGQRRVLPIILSDEDAVLRHYPLIADLSYRRFSDGTEKIASELLTLINNSKESIGPTLEQNECISAAESCVTQLVRWFDQLGRVLAHLRFEVDRLDFEEFSEILTQLHLQIAANSPIYLQDVLIREVIEKGCPDFDEYAHAKGTLRVVANSETTEKKIRQELTKFLELCEEAEKTAIRVKNPAWYGPGHPARQSVLTDAISELNDFRLKLREQITIITTLTLRRAYRLTAVSRDKPQEDQKDSQK